MKPTTFFPLASLTALVALSAHAAEPVVEEILVSADFRAAPLSNLATSVSVIDAEAIRARGAEHLAEVLNLAPNVNFSAGASRGRFFQIRGIGERSQFVEPINPSVGLLIDGIDLTGIGAAATTLDIQQVEILRGPQGTLYGANALAGLINMVSSTPGDTLEGEVAATIGDYNTRTLTGILSTPVSDNLGFRIALEQHQSDGYQSNDFLHTDDNANIDEQTARAKLRWQPSDNLTLDLTGLYVNVDNGYDGFSLDNTRTTLSDQPGHDRQETAAGSARLNWSANDAFNVIALISHADSDLEYGYDEDWAYPDICIDFSCMSDGYNSSDNYRRDNKNTNADLRLVSNQQAGKIGWVAGIYWRDQSEQLVRENTYLSENFLSDFNSENRALYGQLELPLSAALTLVTGARYEEREADYSDSDAVRFAPDENFWGGKIALEYRTADDTLIYALASRGYKAGGFNSNTELPASDREFSAEYLWNYETGLKTQSHDGRVAAQIALFYQDRDDIQTKQSLLQTLEGDVCPCNFTDYTTNAAAGNSYGLEAEINWQANHLLALFASLGLLKSEFENFSSYVHAEADQEAGIAYDLSGHDLPHAPRYQFTVGSVLSFTDNWYARLELEGKDSFYFSSRHEAEADAYTLVNARVGYRNDTWELAVYGRNLTDEDTQVRGFGAFGNDPRDDYTTKPYYQYGEPRMIGASASYRF